MTIMLMSKKDNVYIYQGKVEIDEKEYHFTFMLYDAEIKDIVVYYPDANTNTIDLDVGHATVFRVVNMIKNSLFDEGLI